MGGYSIYGSSLDRSDMGVRLEAVMADEKGGPDGWKIENCVLLGFELIRTVEREIHQPMFFNTQKKRSRRRHVSAVHANGRAVG